LVKYKTQEKYYLFDKSIKYCQMGVNTKMIAAMLENTVFLELKRRGYDVYIGKIRNEEFSFLVFCYLNIFFSFSLLP